VEANLFEVTIACAALNGDLSSIGQTQIIYAAETAILRRRVYGASEHTLLLYTESHATVYGKPCSCFKTA